MNTRKETLPVDKSTKKVVVDANSLIFSIVDNKETTNFSQINNLSDSQAAIFSECLPYISEMRLLLSEYSNIPFTKDSYEAFERKYHLCIDAIDEISRCDEVLKESVKKMFRGILHDFITQSKTVSRALSKPFGYPGDYKLLQNLYDNKVISELNIGKYYDQMFLNDPLSQAVVNRVKTMGQKLIDFIEKSPKSELNILNISSGSGFDLIPAATIQHNKKITIHCFDQELPSLLYLKNKLSLVNQNIVFKFYKEDIRYFFKKWDPKKKFDLIYNIGLADYLPDRILKNLMQSSIDSLNPNGEFIIAHKDYTRYPTQYPEWTCDWNFYKRSLKNYHEFIKTNIQGYLKYDIFYESGLKIIYFGHFTKI